LIASQDRKGKKQMTSLPDIGEIFTQLPEGSATDALDVFGPTVEFISFSNDDHNQICVMRGVVPPGVTVPLHSHADFEDFFIVSGTQQVLLPDAHGLHWRDVHAGDYVRVPGGIPHAHRNISRAPAVELVITTARLGQFFQEAGRPVAAVTQPPSPQELARFVDTAGKYGYQLGTREQNAAVGIELPPFAD
jgi:quercetin dioxygenase-like cupin family protein